MIVLVHSGITDAGMWDGYELEGEVTRHHLSGPISVDAPVVLVGRVIPGAREPPLSPPASPTIAFWAPNAAERLRPMVPGSFELEVDEIEQGRPKRRQRADTRGGGRARQARLSRDRGEARPGAADAEHAVIPGAAHLPSLEQPEGTSASVLGFLKGKKLI